MEDKDIIKDLFSEKLNGFEANVRPELWTNISSQIGAAAESTASGGLSILTKAIIGITVAASVVGVGIILMNSNKQEEKEPVIESKNIENRNIKESNQSISSDKPVEQKKQQNSTEDSQSNKHLFSDSYLVEPIQEQLDVHEEILAPVLIEKIIYPEKIAEKEDVSIKESLVEENVVEEKIPENKEIVEVVSIDNASIDLPNVFTPNGDRINDFLSIDSKLELNDFSVVVIDQNSSIVYKSNDPNFVWDGTGMNGEIVEVGNYVYYITARDINGKLISKHSLLRIER